MHHFNEAARMRIEIMIACLIGEIDSAARCIDGKYTVFAYEVRGIVVAILLLPVVEEVGSV